MTRLPDSTPAAVVFDFDGVLVDSEAAHGKALLAAAAHLRLTPPGDRPDWYIGLGDAVCFRQMAKASGVELREGDLEMLIGAKATAFADLCASGGAVPFPGAVALVQSAAASLPIAVCSGSRRCDIEPVLNSLGIRSLFSTIVTMDDVARTKPDPEPYLLAASRLRIPPVKCIAIEDSPAGVAAAIGAGYGRVHAVCSTFRRERLHAAHEVHDRIANITLDILLKGQPEGGRAIG